MPGHDRNGSHPTERVELIEPAACTSGHASHLPSLQTRLYRRLRYVLRRAIVGEPAGPRVVSILAVADSRPRDRRSAPPSRAAPCRSTAVPRAARLSGGPRWIAQPAG